jgi:hypothetical protein
VTVGGAAILLVVLVAARSLLPGMMAALEDRPAGALSRPVTVPVPEDLP